MAGENDSAPAGGDSESADIDVEQLADRVYRILMSEVRLGRVRGELLPKAAGRGGSAG